MNNQNRKSLVFLLIIQAAITILYGLGLVSMGMAQLHAGDMNGLIQTGIEFLPELLILILSLLPQFSLLIKHKLHSQDGEILPVLFTVTALQASMIIEKALDVSGYLFMFPDLLVVLQRFSLLGGATLFLFSAIRYYGFSSPNISYYTFAFLAISFILSAIPPMNTFHGKYLLTGSAYDTVLQISIICIYLATIVTFIITAFKDMTSLNIKRTIAFICLAVGLYLVSFNTLYSAAFAIVLYFSGTIILILNAGDSL